MSTVSVPAPVGGLNARDSLASMPPTDADLMSNWFPTPTGLQVRGGSADWATGMGGWVETVMVYNGYTLRKMFAAASGNIYDATAQGTVGSAVVTGNTSNRWQYVNFGTAGGQFLIAVNGNDHGQVYNGSTWSAASLTGVADTLLITPFVFKGRLYFIQRDTLKIWYLAAGSISGALSAFDLSSIFKLGGYLVAASSWNVDTVAGPQDYLALISSEGEVAVYQGYDPTQSSTWSLVGTFRVGRPVGRRCLQKIGADLVIISADGLYPLSDAMLTDRSQEQKAISYKIENLINSDVQSYGNNFGWQVLLYPIGNKIMVNVPMVENVSQYQYVMNTITQAWTVFNGWNAACFEQMGDVLFYGTNGKVVKCDFGGTDNGAAIITDLGPAYSYFGSPGENKQFTMARPVFQKQGSVGTSVILNTDFRNSQPTSTLTLPPSANASFWNVAPWNTSFWSYDGQIQLNWQTVFGVGYCASLRMKTISKTSDALLAIDYGYQRGGVL